MGLWCIRNHCLVKCMMGRKKTCSADSSVSKTLPMTKKKNLQGKIYVRSKDIIIILFCTNISPNPGTTCKQYISFVFCKGSERTFLQAEILQVEGLSIEKTVTDMIYSSTAICIVYFVICLLGLRQRVIEADMS